MVININDLSLPQDLKKLSLKEMRSLSDQIKDIIINVVSNNGGHLASNLGVIDLSIAIHTALDSPEDKIIWDVGHQAYTHKILTGRLGRIHTLRQTDGLSGFTKRSESKHDMFGAGHAATSISAALGIAQARDLKNEKFAVCAVIGDASISSGQSFEAINNIKSIKGSFLIILNDNEMSISNTVGALSDHITSIRYNSFYRKFKKKVEKSMLLLPQIGQPLVESIDKLIRRTKHLVINYQKTGVIYEEFGLRYFGPIEANNIPQIIGAIKYAKSAPEPVLIHIISKKGQGYNLAEQNPTKFHGLNSFDKKTGQATKPAQGKTYTKIFGETIFDLAKKNKNICTITAAMTDGTGLDEYSKKFPDRFIDVGINEEHAVTFAGGMAIEGIKSYVAIYSTFLQRSYDQIIHDIALQKLPIVFCIDRAGLVGSDGPTHHGVFDLPYLRMIPNMVILAPKDGQELIDMLHFCQKYQDGPIAIRYPKRNVPEQSLTKINIIELGKAEFLLQNKNATTTVIAIGSMVAPIHEVITENYFPVNLINIRFLKPLDKELLLPLLKSSKNVLTYEEGVMQGGLYSAISEFITEEKLQVQLKGIGIPFDTFVSHGDNATLLEQNGLDKESMLRELSQL